MKQTFDVPNAPGRLRRKSSSRRISAPWLLLLLLGCSLSTASSSGRTWTKQVGTEGVVDWPRAVLALDDGGSLVVVKTFDGQQTGLVRLDDAGRALWSRLLAPGTEERVDELAAAPDGDVYLLGDTDDPALGAGAYYVARMAVDGTIRWEWLLQDEGTGGNMGRSIATTDGGLLVVGDANIQGHLIKLSADGDLEWDQLWTTAHHQHVHVYADGSYLVGGQLLALAGTGPWLGRYAADHSLMWELALDFSNDLLISEGMHVDSSGGIWHAGWLGRTVDEPRRGWLSRVSADGTVEGVWFIDGAGGQADLFASDLAADDSLWIGGSYTETGEMFKRPWWARLSSTGEWLAQHRLAARSSEQVEAIDCIESGGAFLAIADSGPVGADRDAVVALVEADGLPEALCPGYEQADLLVWEPPWGTLDEPASRVVEPTARRLPVTSQWLEATARDADFCCPLLARPPEIAPGLPGDQLEMLNGPGFIDAARWPAMDATIACEQALFRGRIVDLHAGIGPECLVQNDIQTSLILDRNPEPDEAYYFVVAATTHAKFEPMGHLGFSTYGAERPTGPACP